MRYDVSKHNEQRKCVLPEPQIEADYLSGMTIKEIADKHSVSVQPIKRILSERDVPRRPAKQRAGAMSGAKNPRWKGGKRTRPDGYVVVWTPSGEQLEHRVVAARMLGRPLKESEVVHHIDGDRSNNHPSNLEIHQTQQDHALFHARQTRERLLAGGKKQCTHCLQVKPLSEFYKTKFNAMGVQSWCKQCKNKRDKERKSFRSSSAGP